MGRFARPSERDVANPNQVKMAARPRFVSQARFKPRSRQTGIERNPPSPRAPSDLKYFVLALAALIGLGVGWLSGTAITGWLPQASSTPAVVDHAAAASAEEASEGSRAAPLALPPEAGRPSEAVRDEALPDANAPAETVAQAAPDNTQMRDGRKVARQRYRRNARGNFFTRPLKMFRKLRVW